MCYNTIRSTYRRQYSVLFVVSETRDTPFGRVKRGETIEAHYTIAEWFIHNRLATVARNWRWPGEKHAPRPIADRAL